jgi:transcription elongation factor Elf1
MNINCPHCGKETRVPDVEPGQQFAAPCFNCGKSIQGGVGELTADRAGGTAGAGGTGTIGKPE